MNEAVISIPASSWWPRAAACTAVLACAFLADGARAVDAADTIYRNGVVFEILVEPFREHDRAQVGEGRGDKPALGHYRLGPSRRKLSQRHDRRSLQLDRDRALVGEPPSCDLLRRPRREP
jgi:hypothetical protein